MRRRTVLAAAADLALWPAVANTRAVTEASLHALSQEQQHDVIAYILSLRDRR
jgi:hypothetical protein